METYRRFRTADADEMARYMNSTLVNLRERATRNINTAEEVK